MASTYSVSKDVKEALEMAQQLNDYVRSDELYGSTSGMYGGNTPALTIGALLMRLRRLDAMRAEFKKKQLADFEKAQEMHRFVQNEWTVHYEHKMLKEAESRLDAMRGFFDECNDSPKQCRSIYRPEASRRTIVEEIRREMAEMGIESEALEKKVKERDGKLRSYLEIAPFIWDEALKPVYPEQKYWWLYAIPSVPEDK